MVSPREQSGAPHGSTPGGQECRRPPLTAFWKALKAATAARQEHAAEQRIISKHYICELHPKIGNIRIARKEHPILTICRKSRMQAIRFGLAHALYQ